eukprot:7979316-Lingulodinium_polyedra.AAC.1
MLSKEAAEPHHAKWRPRWQKTLKWRAVKRHCLEALSAIWPDYDLADVVASTSASVATVVASSSGVPG